MFVENVKINVFIDKLCLETYGYFHQCDRKAHQSHFTLYSSTRKGNYFSKSMLSYVSLIA